MAKPDLPKRDPIFCNCFVFVFNRGDTRYHGGLRSRELCQAPMVKVQALSSHSHHSLVWFLCSAKFLSQICKSKCKAQWTGMEYWQQKLFGMKYCSDIWFLHTTGLLRHQRSQKNLKRPKKNLKAKPKVQNPKFQKFIIFSAVMDHME